MPTQRLAAHLPMLFHPEPKEVAVIGLGTGSTAGSMTLYPVDRVTVVEIEAARVEGARYFHADNHGIHDNPRADIVITVGRLHLRLNPGRYDVITSQPSNPWLAGTSDLFTVEFFTLGARALRPGGIFCQWLQIYGMSPENLKTLIHSFHRAFLTCVWPVHCHRVGKHVFCGSCHSQETESDGLSAGG